MNFLKGQSAIEYLTTYGWMILAVGVATAFLFQTVERPCINTSSGFLGQNTEITDYGITTSGNFTMLVKNNKQAQINITEIVIEKDGIGLLKKTNNTQIEPFREKVVNAGDGLEAGNKCTEFRITIYHDIKGLDKQRSSGIIRTHSGIGEEPLSPQNISVTN